MLLSVQLYIRILVVCAVTLLLAHLVLNWINYKVEEVPWLLLQLFELDEENNLPTWFSSFVLLNNSVVLVLAAHGVTSHRMHWQILAVGFLVLAMDEVAGLHETFHSSIDDNWTLYAAPLVALVAVGFVPFLLSLPRKTAVWFVIAGALYVGGALGVEFLAQDMDEESLDYALAVALEEGAEMSGALLFLSLNLMRLKELQPSTVIELR